MSDNNMFDELFTIQKLTREQAEAVRKEPTSVFSSLDPKIAKQVAEISQTNGFQRGAISRNCYAHSSASKVKVRLLLSESKRPPSKGRLFILAPVSRRQSLCAAVGVSQCE